MTFAELLLQDLESQFTPIFIENKRKRPEKPNKLSHHVPAADLMDKGDAFELLVELPGVPKDKLHAEILNGCVNIEAETREEKDYYKDKTQHIIERRMGKFKRSFTLPNDVDASNVSAEFQDGVLRMIIPKTKATTAQKITIS